VQDGERIVIGETLERAGEGLDGRERAGRAVFEVFDGFGEEPGFN